MPPSETCIIPHQHSSTDTLDAIPEDRPSNDAASRSAINRLPWWHVMMVRQTALSSLAGGSSTRGVESGYAGTESIPSDVADTPSSTAAQQTTTATLPETQGKSCKCCALVALVLICIIVGVTVGVTVGRKEPAPEQPSLIPQAEESITSLEKKQVHALIVSISGEDALMDKESPQSKARRWILHQDPANVSIANYGEDEVAQRYVLSVLHYGLGGPVWKLPEPFLTEASECTWPGVTCGDSGLVMSIDWTELNLKGRIQPEIGSLLLLEQVRLARNMVMGAIPARMWDLAFLNLMDFTDNTLTGTLSSLVWDMPFLKYFYIDGNNITGTLPELPSVALPLKDLRLHKNRMVGSLPPSLSNLVNLQTLVLYGNAFDSTLEQISWDSMPNLAYLDLSWNNFSGPLPDEIASLRALEFLYLNDNRLSGTLPEELGDLPALQELWLQSNNFTGPIPQAWGDLDRLRELLLQDNGLSGLVPQEVCNLVSLQRLEADCSSDANYTEFGVVECDCCTTCH